MSFVKGQQCFITIDPWSKQGAECRQYFKTRSEVVLDELDIDISKLYIRKAIVAKVNPKYGETEVKVIGTRHGEKLYETLVTREEMVRAIDMGNYYRIPCDCLL